MILSKTGNISVVTQETLSVVELVARIDKKYNDIAKDNIIVNLFSIKSVKASDLTEFLLLSKRHKEANLSFVIVANGISYDDAPEELSVVPTLKEAHDLIDMEEIERDLGI